MLISLVNESSTVSTAEVFAAVRAINRQLRDDFTPAWYTIASLCIDGLPRQPRHRHPPVRGNAVIYLADEPHPSDASLTGYHARTNGGLPFGFVYTSIAKKLQEDWTVSLSHEVLELAGDPSANLLVSGPHPGKGHAHTVYRWVELCDPVQTETYSIDGIAVCNFVLPAYFTAGHDHRSARNDFLDSARGGAKLRALGVRPGGYIGFHDPIARRDETYFAPGDRVAARRLKTKKAVAARRSVLRAPGRNAIRTVEDG
ncbi:MAG: hypothetical protein NVS3B10_05210 [Polyangiales bacterium]